MYRTRFYALAAALAMLLAAPSLASARCFSFRGEDIKVCVDGSDGAARRRAAEVCEDVVGHSCRVSGDSGECRRSGSTRCYDGNGDEHDHIDPD